MDLNRIVSITLAAALAALLGCEGQATYQQPKGGAGDGWTVTTADEDPPWAPQIVSFDCDSVTADAPLSAACTVSVNPGSIPGAVACDVTIDGVEGATVEPSHLDDCAAHAGEVKISVPTPGDAVLTLTAKDARGFSATRTVSLSAHNVAPVIASFKAAKDHGTAPLSTTFAIEVSDANGDALTCTVDLDGDGAVDQTVDDCASFTTAMQTYAAGAHSATLTVDDGHGGTVTQTVALNAVMPVGDVKISSVEYGQSVVTQTLKLVEDKAAVLKVSVVSDTAGLVAKGKVSRLENGVVKESLPLIAPPTVPLVEDPTQLASSFYVQLPKEWVKQGLALKVEIDPDDTIPETDETNNARDLLPAIGKPVSLHITGVPVVYANTTGTVTQFEDTMLKIYALHDVQKQSHAPYTFMGDFTDEYGGWSQLLGEVGSLKVADGSSDYYFGFLATASGGIAGLGYIGSPIAVGLDSYGHVVPHELGHNFSLPHAPCGPVGGANASFPYPAGNIGTYGIDNDTLQLIPPSFADLMSYCFPIWISDYYYNQSQSFLEAQAYITSTPAAPMSTVLVSGSLRDGKVDLRPIQRIQSWPTPSLELGEVPTHTIRLHTDRGVVDVPVIADIEAEGGGEAFRAVIKDPGHITAVELFEGAKKIFSRESGAIHDEAVTANVQESRDTVRVRWDASTHPAASVAYVNGTKRITLGLWLKGGDVTLPTSELPAGGTFEVSLSGGVDAHRLEFARGL